MIGKNISELLDLMDKKETTSEEIIKIYIKNILEKGLDKEIYKTLCEKEAIEGAKILDEKRKNGEKLGALAGIPLAVTEDISTKGILTEAGSKILKDYIPPFNASLIERLLTEDAIVLGKVKVSEFNLEDKGNSIRCILDKGALAVIGSSEEGKDVLKLKPSYGLVSRYGIISATSSLSPLTIAAKEISDITLILNAISGYDKKDSTSAPLEKIDYAEGLEGDNKFKVKIVKELSNDKLVKNIKELGIDVEEKDIESGGYIFPAYKVLSSAEFASNMARYDGIRYGHRSSNYENREDLYKNTRSEGFEGQAKKTIMFGNYVISEGQYDDYYKKSQQVRSLIKSEIDKILEDSSALVIPLADDLDENLKRGYKELASMTGYPMLSMPYRGAEGEYIELCLLAKGFDEKTLLQLGNKIEKGLTCMEVRNNG